MQVQQLVTCCSVMMAKMDVIKCTLLQSLFVYMRGTHCCNQNLTVNTFQMCDFITFEGVSSNG